MDIFCSAHCKHVPCNTLTHSTNEDLLNIKRKCDASNSKNKTYHTDQRILKTKHTTLTKEF